MRLLQRTRLGIAALALLLGGSLVRADKPLPPSSWTVPSPGGKYVFVMIAGGSVESDAAGWVAPKAQEIRRIRATYPRSGLYRKGSTQPLWTVDWYAYAHGVFVASDGVHLIRRNHWASSTDQTAVSFFANGRLTRSYRIKELVDFPFLLLHFVSHFEWDSAEQFDDNALTYTVRTKDGNRFVIDVQTGEVVSSFRAGRWLAGLILTGIALVWMVYRRARRTAQRRRAEALEAARQGFTVSPLPEGGADDRVKPGGDGFARGELPPQPAIPAAACSRMRWVGDLLMAGCERRRPTP
jgi:hypothetical protein